MSITRDNSQQTNKAKFWSTFFDFLKIGATAFGGPAGGISAMETANQKHSWLSQEDFGLAVSITKILPGPVVTQLAIWIGQKRGGRLAGLAAGLGFVFPALLLVTLIFLTRPLWITVPRASDLLAGLQGATVTVVFLACWSLFRPLGRNPWSWAIAISAGVVTVMSARWELAAILVAGLLSAWLSPVELQSRKQSLSLFPESLSPENKGSKYLVLTFILLLVMGLLLLTFGSAVSPLFVVTLKAAWLTFGTGFAVLPVLEAEFVHRLSTISAGEFLESVAVGQLTPGPVLISATYMGLIANGLVGGAAATLGAFLPGFINVIFLVPTLGRTLLLNPRLPNFVRGALPAVVGGLAISAARLSLPLAESRQFWFGLGGSTLLQLVSTWAFKRNLSSPWILAFGAMVAALADLFWF